MQRLQHFNAADDRHHHVEQHEVDRRALDALERLAAAARHRDVRVAELGEPPGENLAIVLVVVDDQQCGRGVFDGAHVV
jgi:hypothetical protein